MRLPGLGDQHRGRPTGPRPAKPGGRTAGLGGALIALCRWPTITQLPFATAEPSMSGGARSPSCTPPTRPGCSAEAAARPQDPAAASCCRTSRCRARCRTRTRAHRSTPGSTRADMWALRRTIARRWQDLGLEIERFDDWSAHVAPSYAAVKAGAEADAGGHARRTFPDRRHRCKALDNFQLWVDFARAGKTRLAPLPVPAGSDRPRPTRSTAGCARHAPRKFPSLLETQQRSTPSVRWPRRATSTTAARRSGRRPATYQAQRATQALPRARSSA